MIHRVFVDLDNTLLPFDTLWPVWKAILAAGLRPNLSKVTLQFGFQSIAKSLMASCFAGMPFQEYKAFLFDVAKSFANDIDPSVKFWSEDLVSDKSHIHILTGSFLPAGDSYSDRYLLEKCSLRYFPRNTSRRLMRYFAVNSMVLYIFSGGK